MSDLVQRLSSEDHPVVVSLRPERTVRALKECLDRGYVHIKFTNTRGGTELGIPVDVSQSDLSRVDFDKETGDLTLVGALTLDYVRVKCTAHINLPSLDGTGRLEPLAD